jgi:hypothetical protein
VTKLADADLDTIEIEAAEANGRLLPPGPDGPSPSWKAMLDQLRENRTQVERHRARRAP